MVTTQYVVSYAIWYVRLAANRFETTAYFGGCFDVVVKAPVNANNLYGPRQYCQRKMATGHTSVEDVPTACGVPTGERSALFELVMLLGVSVWISHSEPNTPNIFVWRSFCCEVPRRLRQ